MVRTSATVTFGEWSGKTGMWRTRVPHQSSDAELAGFTAAVDGMDKGRPPAWSCWRSC